MGRFGTRWEISRVRAMQRQGLMHRSKNRLFNDLIGTSHERHRHLEPDCPCSLEVDDQLEFCCLLYRKTGGTSPAKNFVDVDGGTTIKVGVARPIRDQPSGIDVLF